LDTLDRDSAEIILLGRRRRPPVRVVGLKFLWVVRQFRCFSVAPSRRCRVWCAFLKTQRRPVATFSCYTDTIKMAYHTLSMANTGRYIIHEYRYYFFFIFYTSSVRKTIYLLYIYIYIYTSYMLFTRHSGVTSLPAVAAVVVLMQQHVTHISKHRFPLARPYIYIYIYMFVCVGSLSN